MATISITIPDVVATRVFDALAATYGYDVNTGDTKAQFARKVLVAFVRDVVRSHEATQAAEAARAASLEKTANELGIS